jgi:hypothetical protein
MRRHFGDRFGDGVLFGLTVLASLVAMALIVAIIYQVINGASLAVSTYGLSFLGHTTWNPVTNTYGAGSFIYGTLVIGRGAAARRAARHRDRPLSEPARLAPRRRRNRAARRAPGGDSERHPRPVGNRHPRPVPALEHRISAAQRARLDPAFRPGFADGTRPLHRDPDPHDHGAADHRLDHP